MNGLDHVFLPSGDACDLCNALEGERVSPGYKPHDNCTCQTIPVDDQGECETYAEHAGNNRYGNGPYDVISGIEVTVICADGSMLSISGQFDGGSSPDWDAWHEGLQGVAEDLADELCAQCPEPEPFLCC